MNLKETQAKSDPALKEMKASIQQLTSKVSSLARNRMESERNRQDMTEELKALRASVKKQDNSASLSDVEFEHLKVEASLRKNNLILEGVREAQHERESDDASGDQAFYFIQDILGLSRMEIDMAYRLGKPRYGSAPPRPLFVRLTRLGDRMQVWKAKARLNNAQYLIKEDLPMQLRPIQAALLKVEISCLFRSGFLMTSYKWDGSSKVTMSKLDIVTSK